VAWRLGSSCDQAVAVTLWLFSDQITTCLYLLPH